MVSRISYNSLEFRCDVDNLCYAAGDLRNIARVKELLDKYGAAIVNVRSHNAYTPLMYAANWGHTEAAALLLANGADINLKGADGTTALISAAWNTGRKETVLLLLENGAAIDEKNAAGETALSRAREQGMTDIAELLEQRLWAREHAQFLKDTDFSQGLEKPIPVPRPFKFLRPKP